LPMQKHNLPSTWDAVFILPADSPDVSEIGSYFAHYRAMLPHIRLHVLLCVFLN
jgi:hypothetical protein